MVLIVRYYQHNNGEIVHSIKKKEEVCLNHFGKIIGNKLIKYINNFYKLLSKIILLPFLIFWKRKIPPHPLMSTIGISLIGLLFTMLP